MPDSQLPRHRPTGITFPATAGSLPRSWVHEKTDNAQSVRAGYGKAAWVDVRPSSATASEQLAALKRSIQVRHPATQVTRPPQAVAELFAGWETALLKHHDPNEPANGPLDQRKRDFVAARRCRGYMLTVRSWSVDAGDTEPLVKLGQAMRRIFASPGTDGDAGFACEPIVATRAGKAAPLADAYDGPGGF